MGVKGFIYHRRERRDRRVSFLLYIKYNFYLFRTQIYMDLRRFILV